MRKKIEGLRTLKEYIGTLESIMVFLEENEQHGDDYTDEKKCLRDILVDYEYTLNRANAENPTIDNVWKLQSEKKELEKEVKGLGRMADELIAIWEILEEDYPHVDRAIVKELVERKIGDYEAIE